jgi:hypothetical protein
MLLESDHHPCHVRGSDSLTPSKMTDIVVLAENATEVTVGEKDGPGSVDSHEWVFLTKMGEGTGNGESRVSPAIPQLAL